MNVLLSAITVNGAIDYDMHFDCSDSFSQEFKLYVENGYKHQSENIAKVLSKYRDYIDAVISSKYGEVLCSQIKSVKIALEEDK